MPPSPMVCRHFLQNRCTQGEACNFSHDTSGVNGGFDSQFGNSSSSSSSYPPVPSFHQPYNMKPTSVCRHYLLGRCSSGATCRFSHVIPQAKPGVPICRHFPLGKCSLGDKCNFSHVVSTGFGAQSLKSAEPCRHNLVGKCNYGAQCKFTHEGCDGQQMFGQQQQFQTPPALGPVPNVACRLFLENKCTYGDSCRFSHQMHA